MNEELERLAAEYDSKFGPGKSDEIIVLLVSNYSEEDQIEIFRKAKGREIIVTDVEGNLDAVKITYK